MDFFYNAARASPLALAIILKIQVPLQKFPFLLRYTIPWVVQWFSLHAAMAMTFASTWVRAPPMARGGFACSNVSPLAN